MILDAGNISQMVLPAFLQITKNKLTYTEICSD